MQPPRIWINGLNNWTNVNNWQNHKSRHCAIKWVYPSYLNSNQWIDLEHPGISIRLETKTRFRYFCVLLLASFERTSCHPFHTHQNGDSHLRKKTLEFPQNDRFFHCLLVFPPFRGLLCPLSKDNHWNWFRKSTDYDTIWAMLTHTHKRFCKFFLFLKFLRSRHGRLVLDDDAAAPLLFVCLPASWNPVFALMEFALSLDWTTKRMCHVLFGAFLWLQTLFSLGKLVLYGRTVPELLSILFLKTSGNLDFVE